MVARIAVAAVIAASGCYAPSFADCELSCSIAGTCPDGFECMGNVCRPPGATLACPVTTDAPLDDAPMNDGQIDAGPTVGHPNVPWGAPTQALNSPNGAGDPTLTEDLLELYVTSGIDILLFTRTSVAAPWTNAGQPSVINTGVAAEIDGAPYISPDGLTMHWMSSRPFGMGGNDIWRATRLTRMSTWGSAQPVSELNSGSLDMGGSISADGLAIAIASDRDGATAGEEIYIATRTSMTSLWSTATRVGGINTSSSEGHPILSPDKLTIYFHSNRIVGSDMELFEAHRANPTASFGAPRQLTELGTVRYEGEPWVSADGRRMFFTRIEGGQRVLYQTTR